VSYILQVKITLVAGYKNDNSKIITKIRGDSVVVLSSKNFVQSYVTKCHFQTEFPESLFSHIL
jgi:hypothetical protein